MRLILASAWPLLFAMLLIMMGHGLQSTLLGLRASAEGFPVFATGIIMSLYYIGFMAGTFYIPKMIAAVGHIRVFTAMASLASITILLHGIFVDIWLWGLVRIITGFTYAGLYIITESWLSDAATNKTRGKIFAIYLTILHLGLFTGQYYIQLAPIESISLFILVSFFVSVAVIPIALSKRPAPHFEQTDPISIKRLFAISPLSVMGVLTTGICGGTYFSIGAIVANEMDFTTAQISNFMAAYVLGSALLPPVTGWLSDYTGRRKVIIGCALLSAVFIYPGLFIDKSYLYILAFFSGGFIVSLHGLCLAYMNDHLEQKQFVPASAAMILVNACGAAIGPIVVTILMGFWGVSSFFIVIGMALTTFCAFALYRSGQTQAIPLEEQSDFIAVPQNSASTLIQIAEEDMDEDEDNKVDEFVFQNS